MTAIVESWPVQGSFNIARGAKAQVDVVVAAVRQDGNLGMGEATPIYYRGENAGNCLAQIEAVRDRLKAEASPAAARHTLQGLLPAGAARAAIDAALWELEAKAADRPVWQLAGLASAPRPLPTAFTISLGPPADMEAAARQAAANGYSLLKLKLTGEGDQARVTAVHRGAPDARLIVDANESWREQDVESEAAALVNLGVEMIEQPLPDGADHALGGITAACPIFADESCHSAADIPALATRYDGVNIKLDKAGGLTEALKIAAAAHAHDMQLMVGCMLCTSLGIAPAFLMAQMADYVDLDGPALLARDREDNAFRYADGIVFPPG